MKFCPVCRSEKDKLDFNKRASSKDGLFGKCRICERESVRIRNLKNPEKRAELHRQWVAKNREKRAAYRKVYYAKNHEYIIAYSRNHHRENKVAQIAYKNRRAKERRKTDVAYRLQNNLRGRLWYALKRSGRKITSAIVLVGCDMEFLKAHIEKQWLPGMTWGNHARDGWHIDHIVQCCHFDLSDPEQQKKCFHWSNLQPLWFSDNCRKNQFVRPTTSQTPVAG